MSAFPNRLLEGHRRFLEGGFRRTRERYRDLAGRGQEPQTLLIACCDSRATPETVFDAGPGELFVVRNVAGMVRPPARGDGPDATSAAVEFAVRALRVRDIVVMGHAGCGGIEAALEPGREPLSPEDFIGRWMRPLGPAADEIRSNATLTPTQRRTALERMSVRDSVASLRTFPFVREPDDRGEIGLHGAWFDIATGELWLMDGETGDFARPGH